LTNSVRISVAIVIFLKILQSHVSAQVAKKILICTIACFIRGRKNRYK
jgi:hypothetical protein